VQTRLAFTTIAICVLPDHLHAIWELPENDQNFPKRWSLIKAEFSRRIPASPARSRSKMARREKGIWQRRYWEHMIRDDDDFSRHMDYSTTIQCGTASSLVCGIGRTAASIEM
jgi:putative transposase